MKHSPTLSQSLSVCTRGQQIVVMKNEHIISHPEGVWGWVASLQKDANSVFVRIGSVFAGSPNFPIWELTSSGSDCHPHSTDGGHTASSTVSTHAFPLPQSQHWLLQPYRRRFNHHQTPPSTRASASLVLCTTLDRNAKRHTIWVGRKAV